MDKSFSYQKHIIAYLDILNFKKIVQDDAYNDLFATLFALINSFAGRDMASMRLKGIKTAVLSDSLIFSIRYSEKAAFHKILNLAEVVQTFLLEKEIITRGLYRSAHSITKTMWYSVRHWWTPICCRSMLLYIPVASSRPRRCRRD